MDDEDLFYETATYVPGSGDLFEDAEGGLWVQDAETLEPMRFAMDIDRLTPRLLFDYFRRNGYGNQDGKLKWSSCSPTERPGTFPH
jgi:hypothetical protein